MNGFQTTNTVSTMWIDHDTAPSHIAELLEEGKISSEEAGWLSCLHENGYVVFPQLFNSRSVAALREDLLNLHSDCEKYLLRMPKGEIIHPNEEFNPPKSRLLDFYVNNERARNMALAPKITRLLELVYGEPPLAFQSLLFTWGTEHSIHVDNTYIVCNPPCALMASWIALEDVRPGCGALAYYPGSHRHPLYLFGDGRIEWRHKEDGKMSHLKYTQFLQERADRLDGEPILFHAHEGHVIVWHSNLVHYGAAVQDSNLTRRSMLTHYCPAYSGKPNYFRFFGNASSRRWGGGYYSSRRYDLRPHIENPYPCYLK